MGLNGAVRRGISDTGELKPCFNLLIAEEVLIRLINCSKNSLPTQVEQNPALQEIGNSIPCSSAASQIYIDHLEQ